MVHRLLHGEGGVTGPDGVVFMGQRRPEQGHDAVAQDLVDRAFVAVHGVHHEVQHRIQDLPGLFRIEAGDQLRRALDVGKEHGDLLALAFQCCARGEDFLSQV